MFGIWCTRSARSVCGAAVAWMKHEGQRTEFADRETAERAVTRLNAQLLTPNVYYEVREIEDL